MVAMCALTSTVVAWQDAAPAADQSAAETLADEATQLQNSGKFPEAANQWAKLISLHPDWQRIGVAYLNLGVCNVSQSKFADAFEPLKQSLKLSGNAIDTPKALMFLGYAQMNYGNQLSLSKEPADLERSSVYLTTATQTLGKIINSFPNFELADQALYFRGQSFYKLNRLNEAINAFEKVADDNDATFRKDAYFDLANAYQRQGELALANDALESFFSIAKTQSTEDLPALTTARLRTAKAKLSLASAAESQNDSFDTDSLYKDVIQILQPVADDQQAPLRDEALFDQALAAMGMGDSKRAASLLETVAALPDSRLSQQAAVLAGRELLDLQQFDQAIKFLRPITESKSQFGVEAAILLSEAFRMTDQPKLAMQVAERWAETAPTNPLIVPLLMEQADATYMVDGRKKEAAKLYSTIALDYPPSLATGDALFKAAAANWETFETDDAVAMATQFVQSYPKHPKVPTAKAILADAAIAKEDFAKGETVYRDLIRDYPNDPDISQWTLRIGWALFLQDKFEQTRDFLKTRVDTIKRPEDQSEAYHWIGESEYELKNYRDAISALNQSLESSVPWERLDTTLFARLQAELALGQFDDALVSVNLLQRKFPNSRLVSESLLRTGESYLDQQKYPEAIAQYKKVISKYPNFEFLPSAYYGLGWAQLRSSQFEEAEATFDKLITTFPKTNLAEQASVGRSIAQRRLGKTDSAITDLISFVETAPAGEQKNNSMLELGLAYVERENWQDAELTFTKLLAVQPKTAMADRAHYELAWIFKELEKPEAAITQFQQLIDDYPNSDLAAEAYFEVGSDLYRRQQYATAAQMFQKALDGISRDDQRDEKAKQSLAEKALFQLAWSQYQLKNFPTAATDFAKFINKFPQSDRAGDVLFMEGQSFFQSDQFPEALAAYQAAQPKLNDSQTANEPQKQLLMLHGAQSANQVGQFQTAIDFATPLTLIAANEVSQANAPDAALVASAWLEIGKARLATDQNDGAIDALKRASKDLGRTGAQARVMIADMLLAEEKFEDAINQYKLVFYGYGGTKSTGEVRALQAYAIYETARASYIRIADASPRMRTELIAEAIKQFRYLADNYSDQPLAEKATEQIKTLEQLQ